MATITCQLLSHSNGNPLQQLYTGFSQLQRRGIVRVAQTIVRRDFRSAHAPQHLRYARYAQLHVVVDGRLQLHYDVHDSREIDGEHLERSDCYFKRSYCSAYLEGLGEKARKVHPLGLNYLVYADEPDRAALQRGIFLPDPENGKLRALLRATGLGGRLMYSPRFSALQALPDFDAPPRILFMTGVWDPHDDPQRAQDKIEERIRINEMRAACVRLLRREFGSRFQGGLIHSEFARRHYPDALLPDNSQSASRHYFELLRKHPVCVATSGLHGSIGWKFAEYVAFAKAIVSEKLNYEVPGGLAPGVNYLEFQSAEDCVTQATRLLGDRSLRHALMDANARYYQSHLRPDVLVLNTLLVALLHADRAVGADGHRPRVDAHGPDAVGLAGARRGRAAADV